MTIGDDIAVWAGTRPLWQQRILQLLAGGQAITGSEIDAAIAALLDGDEESTPEKPLDLALASVDDATVTVAALGSCKGVNALTDDQELDLSPYGLTVVYGDNGSGKSGYARILKEAVGARHPAQILPDVFEDRPDEPSAVLYYAADGDTCEHKVPGPADPVVRQMHFYDEHCGDVYLARKSVITYRPSALVLLDGLIEVCDRLRNNMTDRMRENSLRALDLNLPEGTDASAFVASLTAETTASAIEEATTLDPIANQKRAVAIAEAARLEGSSAAAERARLEGLAQAASSMSALLKGVARELDTEHLEIAAQERDNAKQLREAAVLAATADFADELPGVGGATWRTLWEAARAYSTAVGYHEEAFPVTHDAARCPLCQQALDADARSRLERFDAHMRDTTERDAAEAEAKITARIRRLQDLPVSGGAGVANLASHRSGALDLTERMQALLETAGTLRNEADAWLRGAGGRPLGFAASREIAELDELATSLSTAAAAVDVDAFRQSLAQTRAAVRDLDSHIRICESRDGICAEVDRLKNRRMLEAALGSVATTAITAKSTQLTKLYAGDVIKNEFVRETERLRLRRVTIRDLGGNKGRLEQQPGLEGAKARNVQASDVLSEGEQTAMGLAGFFTEATFDTTRSALILDDPVNSLDHRRRTYVASRLVDFAKDRQVVVFTHDVTFAGALLQAATKQGVEVTPRSVERKGDVPGFVRHALPWKAKDFAARLTQIELELARLTRQRDDLGQDDWDKAVGSWAGDLSELWESCVNSEILDEVYDRGTAQVRVMKFRILSAVTADDAADFQAGYGACSMWARRHNKAPETNYVAPEPDEMLAEVERIRAWQKRVKKYRD
ncbi:AAA family ATPase [Nocardioides alpinus]|uniref:AAA family ATPase n=2 Tax=Nocardioides alpinus TaxID=748909 RepID=A0ABX4QXZ6_9ACTN|nr:AAA family ATPase [Nocardioides alpinus]PKH41706.1 AAA family ATPase [Nocardioides alpinus]